jgi:hypothetical protein
VQKALSELRRGETERITECPAEGINGVVLHDGSNFGYTVISFSEQIFSFMPFSFGKVAAKAVPGFP